MSSATDLKLLLLLEAQDRMGATLEKVDKQLGRMGGTAEKTQAKVARLAAGMESLGRKSMLAGGVMVAGVGATLGAFAALEQAQAAAQNAFGTIDGMDKNWASINKQAIEAGNLYPGTTKDFLELATAMKAAGMGAETIEKGAFKGAAALQVMFKLNPAQAGQQFVAMSKAMGVAGEDSEKFADLIQRTSYATGLSLQEISVAVPYMGSTLKLLGVQGLEAASQVMVMMGVLKQAGVEGSMIGTAFEAFLGKMATLDAKARHLRGGLNVESFGLLQSKGIKLDFFDANGAFKGLPNAVAQMEKLKSLNQQQRLMVMKSLFGDVGERMALVDPGKWNEMAEAIYRQEDLKKRLARITETLGSKFEAAKGSFINLLAAMGEKAAPVLVPLLDKLNQFLGKATEWVDRNPKLVGSIVLVAGTLGAFLVVGGGALVVTAKLITAWGTISAVLGSGGIASALSGLTGGLVSFGGKAMAVLAGLGPAGWIAAAALAAGALLVWRYWDNLKAFFSGFAEGFSEEWSRPTEVWRILGETMDGVARALGSIIDAFLPATEASIGLNREMMAGYTIGGLLAEALKGVGWVASFVAKGVESVLLVVATLVDVAMTQVRPILASISAYVDAREAGKGVMDAWKAADAADKKERNGSFGRVSDRFWNRLENSSMNPDRLPGRSPDRVDQVTPSVQPVAASVGQARASAGGAPVSISYSPTIQVPGATEKDKAWFKEQLEAQKPEILRMVNEAFAQRRRLGFAG